MEAQKLHERYLGGIKKSFIFQSDLGSVHSLEVLLKDIVEEYNIPNQVYYSVVISVNEALSNAIIHGRKTQGKRDIFDGKFC